MRPLKSELQVNTLGFVYSSTGGSVEIHGYFSERDYR